jgi:hypothetical protein
MFQEFDFEVIIKPRKSNVILDHLLRIEIGKVGGSLDNQLLNINLFKIEVVPNYLEDIIILLASRAVSKEYSMT